MTDAPIEPSSSIVIAQRVDIPPGWMGPGIYSFGFRIRINSPARAALIDRRTGKELGISALAWESDECAAGGMWKCDTLEDFQAVELVVTRPEDAPMS